MLSYTQSNGVTVNILTLDQYRELREAEQLNANEAYCITDIDTEIDNIIAESIISEESIYSRIGEVEMSLYDYYKIRVDKVIPTGNFIFFNTYLKDLSSLPLNIGLLGMKGENGVEVNIFLTQEDSQYVLKAIVLNSTYEEIIATGTSLNDMQVVQDYLEITSTGYGKFLTIDYINQSMLDIVDNFIRINHKF